MPVIEIISNGILIILEVFFLVFAVTSLKEGKPRAALFSCFLVAIIGAFQIYLGLTYFSVIIHYVIIGISILFVLLFFGPVGRTSKLKIINSSEQADERTTMFAREEYLPGTEKYEKYYSLHPEHKTIDDTIRALPELLAPGGKFYDKARSGYIQSLFEYESGFVNDVDGAVNPEKTAVDAGKAAALIKEYCRHLGAGDVGICNLEQRYVYSHVGRGPEPWGAPIENNHSFAIVYAVEMDYEKVEEAPRIGVTEETALRYLNTQIISIALAKYIRDMGYSARAHIPGSNYQIMLPPLGYMAGLGELGRMGYLISPKYGARFRLGAVTTDIPLLPDRPINFGVQNFCEICMKCADNCPSGSISRNGKEFIRGVERWKFHQENCFKYWRTIGTDCGLCMKVCPFSHPDTAVHKLLKLGIKRSAFARRISLWGDDIFYGRKDETLRKSRI